MDDNNSFLSSYKKKLDGQKNELSKEAADSNEEHPSLRYEEKSGFVKPPWIGPVTMQPQRSNSRILAPVIIGAVIVLGLAIGLAWYFNKGIEAIDFTNWTVNDAELWATDSSVKLQIEEQYNDQLGAGRIISQDPVKGTAVKKGGFIRIAVSLGHDLSVTLPLPDLISMTKDEIDAWVAGNYMTKVRITAEYSDKIAAGKVISYEINDNTVVDNVKRDTPVYIVVSKGSVGQTAILVTVPDFRQKTISESYVFANENGILLKVDEQYDDYVPKGGIIAQSVKTDEKVKKGDEIKLTVSKGKKITVPSFSGDSKQKATAVAAEFGIPVAITEKYSSESTGTFISQSIAAGSVYEDGDILELTYSLGNKIVLSSFIGQTRDAIEKWAKELNDQGASITISVTNTQSNSPKGNIIYQDKSNTVISVKATIKITVSLGKAVFVPDFVAPVGSGFDSAITREKALAMCEALNIIPIFVKESKANRLPGEIWYQSIAAGTEVSEESTITLKYNPSNVKIKVPNFVNMTETEIMAGDYFHILNITFVTADLYVEGYAGKVYKQSITADSVVAAGSSITLYISPEPLPSSTP